MPDYQKMYKALFNEVTNTIEHLQIMQREVERLQAVQQETEELYLSAEDPLWLADYPKKEKQG